MAARDDCIFCKILAGELPSHAVAENALAYAFADINPATAWPLARDSAQPRGRHP
jgi:hypothetical protein